MHRLIGFDLDGTLFAADSEVADRTLATLERVHERGHTLVAVTGRSWRTAAPRLERVAPIDRIVASNGAYEYRRSQAGVSWARTAPAALWRDWIDAVRSKFRNASFGWELPDGLHFEDAFIEAAGGIDRVEEGVVAGRPTDEAAYKLYMYTGEAQYAELQRVLRDTLAGRAEVVTAGAAFVEVTAPGVDKAYGLSRVARELGFDAERTIVFGDNHNDVPMFRWAGLSIAMENAVTALKTVADREARHHDRFGVAHMLDTLLDEGTL